MLKSLRLLFENNINFSAFFQRTSFINIERLRIYGGIHVNMSYWITL